MKKRIALLLSVILVVLAMPGVSLDASERIISDAIKVLQDFGADDLMILSNTESSQNGDNLVKNPYITVVFNDTSYAFLNEKGVIIRIDTDLIELETYYRANSGFQLEKDKCIISKEKAIAVANDVLNESEKIINTQLATVKTNK